MLSYRQSADSGQSGFAWPVFASQSSVPIGGEASAASEGFAFASTTSWCQSQLSAEASHCRQWHEQVERKNTVDPDVFQAADYKILLKDVKSNA